MENTTPYSLDTAIQQWRADLAQSPAFKPENLNELESHLRDSVARLQASGLSEEEAFLIATRRVGQSGTLEKEFGKVNGNAVRLQRALWMLIGVQLWNLVMMAVGGFLMNAANYAAQRTFWQKWGVPAVWFSFVHLLAIVVSFWLCWYLVAKRGDRIGKWFINVLQLRGRALVGLVGLSLAAALIQVCFWALTAARVRLEAAAANNANQMHLVVSYNFSNVIMTWVQTVVFLVLIFILARKLTGVRRKSN